MRYRIGEVAEFFGMTKEGVRFLEKKGVITSQRDEGNGYRYFPRTEITRLKQIRSYQSLGFSLEEAYDMVCRTRRDELIERLDEKLAELAEKEREIARMKHMLAMQRCAAQSLMEESARFEIVQRNEMILFPRVEEEASGETPAEREAIARARQVEKAWIQAMPPVKLGALHYDAKGEKIYGKFGCVCRAEVAKKMNLPLLPSMIHVPACLCARGAFEAHPLPGPGIDITPLYDWIKTQGYAVCGDAFATIQATYCDEGGNMVRTHLFYVPVCEEK